MLHSLEAPSWLAAVAPEVLAEIERHLKTLIGTRAADLPGKIVVVDGKAALQILD